jgi:hypothetical protein
MTIRVCAFLFFFLWGWFWMGMDGFRMAVASEGLREKVEELVPRPGKADEGEDSAFAARRSWNAFLEWREPGFSGGQIFKEMGTTGDTSIPSSFAPCGWQGMDPEKRYTLLEEGENPFSDANQKEPAERQRDWAGITRDTAFLLGYQVVFAGVLYFLPESVTGWTKEQKNATVKKWKENVQNPAWDKDKFWINYIAHPYFGATYYIRARERGFGEFGSFWYSALLSALYEFGIEAFFEPPSKQDLIVTPVGGFLVGKYIFEPIRDPIKAKPELSWYDHAVLILTDPLGAVNSLLERALGIQSDIRVQFHSPPGKRMPVSPAENFPESREVRFSRPDGVSLQFEMEWR